MKKTIHDVSRMSTASNPTARSNRCSSSSRQQAFLLSLLAVVSLHPLVSFHYLSSNQGDIPSSSRRHWDITHLAAPSLKVTSPSRVAKVIADPVVEAKQFEWKCSDQCSCLPPLRNDTTYMHQSYKTENQTLWPKGWGLFRQSWLDLHKDVWTFVFWLDEHNDLLAQCTGFGTLFKDRGPLQKADLSRLLYLYVYGGLYADSDYLALKSQIPLLEQHPILKDQQVLLQGRQHQPVGLEWGYARTPGHPFFVYCLKNHIDSQMTSDSGAVFVTGPVMLEACLRTYIGKTRPNQPLLPMTPLKKTSIMIVEPKLIAPIDSKDFKSTCGSWRSNEPHSWRDDWATSTCREELLQQGSFAVTFYTQSWGIVDEKEEKEAAVKLEAKRRERKKKKQERKRTSRRRGRGAYAGSGHARRSR